MQQKLKKNLFRVKDVRCQSVQSFFMYLGCINLWCHTWSWQLFFDWAENNAFVILVASMRVVLLVICMLHFNGKNLISERSLKLVPLHTTIPTKGITNESQWSRSCQELPTDTATHPWPKKIWFWGFKTNFTKKLDFIKVYIFREGYKLLRNLHLTFDWYYIGQN